MQAKDKAKISDRIIDRSIGATFLLLITHKTIEQTAALLVQIALIMRRYAMLGQRSHKYSRKCFSAYRALKTKGLRDYKTEKYLLEYLNTPMNTIAPSPEPLEQS